MWGYFKDDNFFLLFATSQNYKLGDKERAGVCTKREKQILAQKFLTNPFLITPIKTQKQKWKACFVMDEQGK